MGASRTYFVNELDTLGQISRVFSFKTIMKKKYMIFSNIFQFYIRKLIEKVCDVVFWSNVTK